MTPEHWQTIKPLLEAALEMDPSARRPFLRQACGNDTNLMAEVESFLQLEDDDLLERSAFESVTGIVPAQKSDSLIGTTVGRYTILSELGAGGMGTVYHATRSDGEFRHDVALKLIRSGFNSESILRRFESERQILASLNHPNIAHLIDGGTTEDGMPFFVMEYVRGKTIVEFAESNILSLEQRLDLFREVCSAVSYAHQNLVIHRDLKPTNILVTADGVPKLLDFGIAKLLKVETTGETATQHFIFTPEYASPEQIRGERLTTASDIYSLGVILYELLTGTRPISFQGKNFGEVIQTATQTDPVRPSEVGTRGSRSGSAQKNGTDARAPTTRALFGGSLKGDLDNIVMKALSKAAERRYMSVEQLSVDIHRHLRGMPVFARKDSWRYRAQKFSQRNPLLVGTVALAFLILIAGIIATASQARQADIERGKAEQRFNDVRSLANSLIFEVNEKIGESPIQARELLVIRGLEYLDKLAAEAEGDAGLQTELAAAYEKIGNVQSEIFSPGLGKTSEALTSHTKALDIRQRLLDAEPGNPVRGADVMRSLVEVGNILSMSARLGEAVTRYEESVRLGESLLSAVPGDLPLRRTLGRTYAVLGQSVLRSGSLSQAAKHYHRSLALYQALARDSPDDPTARRSLSIVHSYIGYVEMEMGAGGQSLESFTTALSLMQADAASRPGDVSAQGRVGTAHLWLGVALSTAGHDEGLRHIRQALGIQEAAYNADKGNFGELNALADCRLEMGRALLKKAERDKQMGGQSEPILRDAITSLEASVGGYQTVWRADPASVSTLRQIAYAQRNLADALVKNGEREKAMAGFREALAQSEALVANDPANIEWQHDAAICHLRIGEILGRKDGQSRSHFLAAKEILDKLIMVSPENVQIKTDLATASAVATY